MENIIYPIVVAAIIAISGLVIGRFSVKTKLQVKVETIDARTCKLEETQPLTVEGMYMLLSVAKKKGEINGESDGLMHRFEDHLFNRK